jgi:hypothetical protein
MSRDVINALQGPYQFAWNLLTRFVEVCPEDLWTANKGGWPVWQQVLHAMAVLNFFVLESDEDPFLPAPCDINVLMLKVQGNGKIGKEEVKAYGENVKTAVDAWVAGLDDARLAMTHQRLSKRIQRDTSYAAAVAMLASHTMYHIGSCDAALRDRGLPGVF